jgi:DNA primase
MRFPQTFIDDLRRQADIVRIISDYVPLKKRGANWVACCPFHKEKTPSFSVNPTKDIFYCFGCGKGGSVYNFVMEMDHIVFPEAIKLIASKAGVPLPEMVEDKRFEARQKESDEVLELNALALSWWETQLKSETPDARAAREYLKKRGISEDTARTFRLGFAPDSWEALSGYLKKQGISTDKLERSGLVTKRDTGGSYDRFRGRLMFPIMDAQGRPVAFGGRTMSPDGEPKYLNSPETSAYTKGRHLYGLNATREEIRKKKFVILVEGYLDLLIPYQHGIRNVVASLGTALTTEQAKLLTRFARKIVVNYDGDRAGINAAKRAIETLLAEDVEVKVLVLPDNADPDEFIRLHGVEEYQKRRGQALPHIHFVLDQAVRDRNLLRPAEKAAAVEEALPYVRAVRNAIQKREFFDMTMDALRIDEASLRSELWQSVKSSAGAELGKLGQKVARSYARQPTVAEQKLLELLVNDAELRGEFLPLMVEADYEDLATASIFQALKKLDSEGRPVDAIGLMAETEGDAVADDLVPLLLISDAIRDEGEAIDDSRIVARKCFNALRLINIDRRLNEVSHKMAAAERVGNDTGLDSLALENKTLMKLRGEILSRNEGA